MSGCLRIVTPIIILVAIAIYCAFPHPTHNQTEMKAIAAESQRLMAIYPISPSEQFVDIPKDKWPPVIASLKPYSVFVGHRTVNITTKPYPQPPSRNGFVVISTIPWRTVTEKGFRLAITGGHLSFGTSAD